MLRLLIGLLLCSSLAVAAEPDSATITKKKIELMETTSVAAVTKLSVPAREYKSDGDPDTLEIVFLEKKEDGPSRVSDDGEVVFLYKASDRKQQALIDQAFETRALRKLKQEASPKP
jgi:hypothetical protein